MTEGLYHVETSPLICSVNQWTSFYMIVTSVMKEWTIFPKNIIDVWQDPKYAAANHLFMDHLESFT